MDSLSGGNIRRDMTAVGHPKRANEDLRSAICDQLGEKM